MRFNRYRLAQMLNGKCQVLWSEGIADAGQVCRKFEAHMRVSGVLKTGTFQAAILTK
jgi:hypothetical protein